MQFGGALHGLLHAIVDANPGHGPVQMAKIDLWDASIRIWLAIADLPKLALVIPPHTSNPEPLIGFHPFVTDGLHQISPLFLHVN
jgi:hypothetical protein